MMEAFQRLLGSIAARTSRSSWATLVTGVTYRNPGPAREDGHDPRRHLQRPRDFGLVRGVELRRAPSVTVSSSAQCGDRMDRLEEAVTIRAAVFTQDRPSFEGQHYLIARALNVPSPNPAGGPKFLIGGGGEKRTLRILAKARRHVALVRRPDPGPIGSANFSSTLRAVNRDPSTVTLA